jgi:hypothetical protein
MYVFEYYTRKIKLLNLLKEDNKRFISNEAGAMASTLLAQSISIPGDLVSYILTKSINC